DKLQSAGVEAHEGEIDDGSSFIAYTLKQIKSIHAGFRCCPEACFTLLKPRFDLFAAANIPRNRDDFPGCAGLRIANHFAGRFKPDIVAILAPEAIHDQIGLCGSEYMFVGGADDSYIVGMDEIVERLAEQLIRFITQQRMTGRRCEQ